MPVTYEPIATTTLTSNAANITFSSIGAGYTDLRLVILSRTTRSSTQDFLAINFNSDTTTTYSWTELTATGISSGRASGQQYFGATTQGNTAGSDIFGLMEIDIFSYAGSTNKTVLLGSSHDRNGSGGITRAVALWRSTNAITSIAISSSTGGINLLSGTTATLYGIKKA